MFDLSTISKDKVYLIVIVLLVIGAIIYIGNGYIKKEIKKGVIKDKHKKMKKDKKMSMMRKIQEQQSINLDDDREMDIDSYINPVAAEPGNSTFAQFDQMEDTSMPKRFGQNDIMQREMLENIRK